MIRNLTRGLMSDLTSSLVGLIQRVFINLESTANAYYSLASPVVFAGDFEISADIVTGTSSGNDIIAGSSAGANSYILVNGGTGTVEVRIAGDNIIGAITVTDQKLHSVYVTLDAGLATLYIDNVPDGTVSGVSGSVTLDNFGANSFGNYFDGIISNVKLTDLDTPANSLEYALNQLTGTTETSNGNTLAYNNIATTQDVRDTFELVDGDWIGSELVVNGGFDSATGWTINFDTVIENGYAQIISPTGDLASFFGNGLALTDGFNYIISLDYINLSGGSIVLCDGENSLNVNNSPVYSTTGFKKNLFLASGGITGLGFKRLSGATDSRIDNVSAKRTIEVA
jgi:hypothetical protein